MRYEAHTVRAVEEYLHQNHLTEPDGQAQQGDPSDGLLTLFVTGPIRPMTTQCVRPMFELIHDEGFSGIGPRVSQPCPGCDNFAYSWKCETHPDLPWRTRDGGFTGPIILAS